MTSDSEDTLQPVEIDDEISAGSSAPKFSAKARMITVLLAVLIGGGAAAGYLAYSGGFDDAKAAASGHVGAGSVEENDFTRSTDGDCLDWELDNAGNPTKTACTEPHRFEVAGELNTADFPGTEFSDAAEWPGPERFRQIRDDQCEPIVNSYLQSGLDPQGRFSVGLLYPSQDQWNRGVRSLRCGVEQPGPNGVQEQFTGRVAGSDQSFAWPAGTCIGIDKKTRQPTTGVVDCTQDHAFQTTGVVDLSQRFGGRNSGRPWPTVKEQNDYLKTICPNQTNQFFGGEENLKKSTLNTQWSVLSEVSWLAGSRRVVCFVGLPDRGGFARLDGDARKELLVNGKVPVPPAEGPPGRALPTPVPGPADEGIEVPAPN